MIRPLASSPPVHPIKQAIVLAAGLGKRMRPITLSKPKPLVETAGKTLLDHALDALEQADVEEAALNVHYLADQIEDHVKTRTLPRCVISDERAMLLDSGGGVAKAHGLFSNQTDPFFILNADSFWLDGKYPNLTAMNEAWGETWDMLLLIARHADAVGFDGAGDFFMNDDGRLTRRGSESHAPYVYAGAIIARPELFADRPDIFSLNQIFDEAIAKGRLGGVVLKGLWLHVGTPEAIGEAEQAIGDYHAQVTSKE